MTWPNSTQDKCLLLSLAWMWLAYNDHDCMYILYKSMQAAKSTNLYTYTSLHVLRLPV